MGRMGWEGGGEKWPQTHQQVDKTSQLQPKPANVCRELEKGKQAGLQEAAV